MTELHTYNTTDKLLCVRQRSLYNRQALYIYGGVIYQKSDITRTVVCEFFSTTRGTQRVPLIVKNQELFF